MTAHDTDPLAAFWQRMFPPLPDVSTAFFGSPAPVSREQMAELAAEVRACERRAAERRRRSLPPCARCGGPVDLTWRDETDLHAEPICARGCPTPTEQIR